MKPIRTLLLAAAAVALMPAMACDRCFSEVMPQPSDGVYHISTELPDKDCYWLFLAELRPDEDLSAFLRRACAEKYAQTLKNFEREWIEVEGKDGRRALKPNSDAPEVEDRGLVLRNPAAPEAWRDVVIPEYRDNNVDISGIREHYYNLFLSIRFSPQGITVRPGEGSCQLALASAPPRFWFWSESEAFLAKLPSMLFGDPKQVVTFHGIESYSQPMRERILSGRRMVILHTEKGMPIAPHWECLAKMVAIVGGQNMAYYDSDIVAGGVEYERRERVLMGGPEFPDAPPAGSVKPIFPDMDVQPVLDLPEEE